MKKKILYILAVGLMLVNIRMIYSAFYCLRAAQEGMYLKMIDSGSKLWYFRSEELLILHTKIEISVFILSLCLAVFFLYKKPKLALIVQLFPILLVVLDILYREFG